MPKGKILCVDDIRHAEYYDMQSTFDDLYKKAKAGEMFNNLMGYILSRENILLAYRNIKNNEGSNTPGTDKLTLKDVGKLSPDEIVEKLRYISVGSKHGYRPKPVRRKEIPKPNGNTRPLGIPCIWDRLLQQCIKQILEPICEAKFSKNSFGFRPNRSVENAIQRCYQLMQRSHLSWVIEFDIEGFFDNVNHTKLIKQIWALGIRDQKVIHIIKRMLKAPIRLENGEIIRPERGTPQGGILSPLLANIVLNELDHWIDSQWQENPVTENFAQRINSNGSKDNSHAYRSMRNTNLKEMYIVRYADDFRIYCRNKEDAERIRIATESWIKERLKLKLSEEKTRIVNMERSYSEFLGFKMKLHPKAGKMVVRSHMSDKALKRVKNNLKEQIKRIEHPSKGKSERDEVVRYSLMVMGLQNYYCIATHISVDTREIQYEVMQRLEKRLGVGSRIRKTGRELTETEKERYGKSKSLRYAGESGEPIYPIGYVKHRHPAAYKRNACSYTVEGRSILHKNLEIDKRIMYAMMRGQCNGSAEYADNRISLYSAQHGKCAVTGRIFENTAEIHCHHKTPVEKGGTDEYQNLILVTDTVHRLIHATDADTISYYLRAVQPNTKQLEKINTLRKTAGLKEIN